MSSVIRQSLAAGRGLGHTPNPQQGRVPLGAGPARQAPLDAALSSSYGAESNCYARADEPLSGPVGRGWTRLLVRRPGALHWPGSGALARKPQAVSILMGCER